MSRSKKRKKNKIPKKVVKTSKVNEKLFNEVNSIKKKFKEEEESIYLLKSKKRSLIEDFVDIILNNNPAINNLLTEYLELENEINHKIKKQNNRKIDLENKENKLSETEKEIITLENDYKKIGEVDYPVGLYNSLCKFPVAICNQKQVFLSYKDVKNKKCLKHKDKIPCKYLIWLSADDTIY